MPVSPFLFTASIYRPCLHTRAPIDASFASSPESTEIILINSNRVDNKKRFEDYGDSLNLDRATFNFTILRKRFKSNQELERKIIPNKNYRFKFTIISPIIFESIIVPSSRVPLFAYLNGKFIRDKIEQASSIRSVFILTVKSVRSSEGTRRHAKTSVTAGTRLL